MSKRKSRYRRLLFSLFLLIVIVFSSSSQAAQDVLVYNNATAELGYWTPIFQSWPGYERDFEAGDQITLAGEARNVTEMDIMIFNAFNTSGTVDAAVRFYINDGPDGSPGTLIWESSFEKFAYSAGDNVFSFSIPFVLVPDTFTWTISLANVQTASTLYNFGLCFYDPPAVGSSADFAWMSIADSGSWISTTTNIVSNFGAAVYATTVIPDQQMAATINFFEASVSNSTLEGVGSTETSADGKLNSLENMLKNVEDLIASGSTAEACLQLADAYKKTDGKPNPADFVKGPAADNLAGYIRSLMANLGCQ